MWKTKHRGLPTNYERKSQEEEASEGEQQAEVHLLPPELWLVVFEHLIEKKDLVACQLVCKEWHTLASRDDGAAKYIADWKERKARREAKRKDERERERKGKGFDILGTCLSWMRCTCCRWNCDVFRRPQQKLSDEPIEPQRSEDDWNIMSDYSQ